MPRLADLYVIYLPLQYNDGREIETEKLLEVRAELLGRFRGITLLQETNPLQGLWQHQDQHYSDEIITVTVLDFARESQAFFTNYKEVLKQRFEQIDLLIYFYIVTVI